MALLDWQQVITGAGIAEACLVDSGVGSGVAVENSVDLGKADMQVDLTVGSVDPLPVGTGAQLSRAAIARVTNDSAGTPISCYSASYDRFADGTAKITLGVLVASQFAVLPGGQVAHALLTPGVDIVSCKVVGSTITALVNGTPAFASITDGQVTAGHFYGMQAFRNVLQRFTIANLVGAAINATTVTNITSSTPNATYNAGGVISIQVTFSAPVTVTGTPTLLLNDGGTAVYASGSGTATLTFTYTVAAGQNTGDLDVLASNSLLLNGGTIRDATPSDASLLLPVGANPASLASNKAIVISTTAASGATVTNVTSSLANGTYGVGQVVPIQVTFSAPVTVTGTPSLLLNNGGVASYASGSGTATLTFNYTVAAGQTVADLDEASTSALALNGGTIIS